MQGLKATIFYFRLLRDSPIDQIVQTVFGYSLRKE